VATRSPEQQRLLDAHPGVAVKLPRPIPRLGAVGEIIACQDKRFDGSNPPALGKSGNAIPFGARLLKVVLDFDVLVGRLESKRWALFRDRPAEFLPGPRQLLTVKTGGGCGRGGLSPARRPDRP
jgi:hypothetical protein